MSFDKIVCAQIDEIIEYYQESDYIDFKFEEYKNYENLLKDVLSFANSFAEGDKFIIIGIKKKEGETVFNNIVAPCDSAIIEQLVHSNITPEVQIEYNPYLFKDKWLVILRLINPRDKPYMLSKAYGKLKKNDCLIRKGTFSVPISRANLDKLYALKYDQTYFRGDINITFLNHESELTIESIKEFKIPSEIQREKIIKIIKEKEESQNPDPYQDFSQSLSALKHLTLFSSGTTYEERSLETLRKNLQNVSDTYSDHDNAYLFEEKAEKINFLVLNNSSTFLEGVTIKVFIPKIKGVIVADQIYKIRPTTDPLRGDYHLQVPDYNDFNYPNVIETDSEYSFEQDLGTLKHQLAVNLLPVDLRMTIFGKLEGEKVPIKFVIYAKSLKSPLVKEIFINVK